eukprot:symbB.v1.2.021993.t1/scaffold1933.1/size95709/2
MSAQACVPQWAKAGQSCPFGVKAGILMGTWTWPNEGATWIHYVAAFYSFMPMTLIFAILLLGLWTRGLREVLAFIFQFLCLIVMYILKMIIKQPRPEGSCSISCGMPSGHTLETIGTFVWICLEMCYASTISSRQKGVVIGVAGLLLIPTGWSRTVLHDHSWEQVAMGALCGTLLAISWYALLQQRVTLWLLKLVKAWLPFMELNYPVDGVVEEAPWAAYGSTAQAKAQGTQ